MKSCCIINPYLPGQPLLDFQQSLGPCVVEFRDNGDLWLVVDDFEIIPVWKFRIRDLDGNTVVYDEEQLCYEITAGEGSLSKLMVKFEAILFKSWGVYTVEVLDINDQVMRRWQVTYRFVPGC